MEAVEMDGKCLWISNRNAECNINQITAKSNDSEERRWRNAAECVRQKG